MHKSIKTKTYEIFSERVNYTETELTTDIKLLLDDYFNFEITSDTNKL